MDIKLQRPGKMRSSVPVSSHTEESQTYSARTYENQHQIPLGLLRERFRSISMDSDSRTVCASPPASSLRAFQTQKSSNTQLGNEPIEIEDEEDGAEAHEERQVTTYEQYAHRPIIGIEDYDDVISIGDEEAYDLASTNDKILQSAKKSPSRRSSKTTLRNLSVVFPFRAIRQITLPSGLHVRIGKTVELRDGNFLLVTHIILHERCDEILLRGVDIQRLRECNDYFEKKQNEACCVFEVQDDDVRPVTEQSLREVNITDVIKLRRLIVTNASYPEDTFRTQPEAYTNEEAEANGPLSIRFCLTKTFQNAEARRLNQYPRFAIEHVNESLLKLLRKPRLRDKVDEERRLSWRGETILGGAYDLSASFRGLNKGKKRKRCSIDAGGMKRQHPRRISPPVEEHFPAPAQFMDLTGCAQPSIVAAVIDLSEENELSESATAHSVSQDGPSGNMGNSARGYDTTSQSSIRRQSCIGVKRRQYTYGDACK